MLMTLYLYKDHETSALSTVSTTGDGFSLGTGVCILKEAARQIIEAAK